MERDRLDGAIEPIPSELLREPLVWFFAEHYRHRDVCKHLLLMAESDDFDCNVYKGVRSFLEHDLPMHILDEEEGLFPLLRKRCEPDDQIEKILDMLSGEHVGDMRESDAVCDLLDRAISERFGLANYKETSKIVLPFCKSQQRHIAVENAVVLPIARLRLTKRDLRALGRKLAVRRDLDDPFADA